MRTKSIGFITIAAVLLALLGPSLHGRLEVISAAAGKCSPSSSDHWLRQQRAEREDNLHRGQYGTTPPSDSITCSQALANALGEGFVLSSTVTSTDSLVVYILSRE